MANLSALSNERNAYIGLDKSTNTNPDYTWFKFPSTTWTPSEIKVHDDPSRVARGQRRGRFHE